MHHSLSKNITAAAAAARIINIIRKARTMVMLIFFCDGIFLANRIIH